LRSLVDADGLAGHNRLDAGVRRFSTAPQAPTGRIRNADLLSMIETAGSFALS
jgi:hypothetical protein